MKKHNDRGKAILAPTRRQMLQRLGLAATAIYAAPVLLRLSGARASGSFSGGSGSGRAVRRAPPPPPELVVAAPSPADLALIAAAGYEILSSERVDLLGSEVARIRSAPGRTLDEARIEIAGLVPAALVDLNHLYRPNELNCQDDGCAAFEMIGWTPERTACGLSPSIGMIDTAVNGEHAALAGSRLEIVPAMSGERPQSSQMHGTAIAILLVGQSDSRTPGLLPDTSLVAVEAFHADSQGDAADPFDLVRAIDLLVERAVGVINMSFAGPANALLERAVLATAERQRGDGGGGRQ